MGPRGQEPNDPTDDAVWQDLVARLEGAPTAADASPLTDAPSAETMDPRSGRAPGGADVLPDGEARSDRERVEAIFRDQPLAGPRDYRADDREEDEDDDEGFTPADPPPLGTGDPLTVLAWIGAAGAPISLLLVAMFWRSAPTAVLLGLLLVFLAGAGYLLTKLPKHRTMGDDGAEV